MEGTILGFNAEDGSGVITDKEGNRYRFEAEAWKGDKPAAAGLKVDFVPDGETAREIYLAVAGTEKSRVIAGVLAILLGVFGIHKFYLGYTTPGLVMLGITLVGIVLSVIVIGTFIIAGIEGILYLTRTDADFVDTYVTNQKEWF